MNLSADDYKKHCALPYNKFMACAQQAQAVNSTADYNEICAKEMGYLRKCAQELYVSHLNFT